LSSLAAIQVITVVHEDGITKLSIDINYARLKLHMHDYFAATLHAYEVKDRSAVLLPSRLSHAQRSHHDRSKDVFVAHLTWCGVFETNPWARGSAVALTDFLCTVIQNRCWLRCRKWQRPFGFEETLRIPSRITIISAAMTYISHKHDMHATFHP